MTPVRAPKTRAAPGSPPPLDPQLRERVAAALAMSWPLRLDRIAQARQPGPGEVLPTEESLSAGGRFVVTRAAVKADDHDIEVVIARPSRHTGILPVVFHTHGGGMIAGDALSGLDEFLEYADEIGLLVISVDYRLAPETQFPGPLEDCYAALVWTAQQVSRWGGDPTRIVVAGTSAGGGLAAGLALLARDRLGPALIGQVLLCPMIDDRNDSASGHQMAAQDTWNRQWNGVAWQALLGPLTGGPDVSPYAAPARMPDLAGLPPAYLDVGSVETFRDEDIAYAMGIWAAGGPAELHVWGGAVHAFDHLCPESLLAREARATRSAWLRRLLHHDALDPGWWRRL